MGKKSNDRMLDASLGIDAACDELCVLSAEPATYYEAKDPIEWTATQAKSLGDAVRPTTRNGFVYENTSGSGTTSGSEPTWPTTPGNTVVDNDITWTCRVNYALANVAVDSGDFTIANGDVSGRKVTVAQQTDIPIHTTGDADHVALVNDTEKDVPLITTAPSQTLTALGTVTTSAFDDEIEDPT